MDNYWDSFDCEIQCDESDFGLEEINPDGYFSWEELNQQSAEMWLDWLAEQYG